MSSSPFLGWCAGTSHLPAPGPLALRTTRRAACFTCPVFEMRVTCGVTHVLYVTHHLSYTTPMCRVLQAAHAGEAGDIENLVSAYRCCIHRLQFNVTNMLFTCK
jgi:hypothetical protein